MLLARRQKNSFFYTTSGREPRRLIPARGRGSDFLSVSARTCSREGAGPTWRRAPGERRFGGGERLFCVGRSAGGGGSECPGLGPFKGPFGSLEEDGGLCVRARGDSVCECVFALEDVGGLRWALSAFFRAVPIAWGASPRFHAG